MVGTHDIFMGSDKIGIVTVEQQGLYYRFCCRCRLTGSVVCRLMAETNLGTESLGIPAPSGNEFALETKLPVKRFGNGKVRFFAQPRKAHLDGKFIPLSPEEPFRYLRRLKNAYLHNMGGEVGIRIADEQ